jgi:non-specific serine/threonine protein kinase
MLLILDNCEHLIRSVTHLVDSLLSSCPHMRVLATSREALGVAGEVKWLVHPLSRPGSQQPPAVENLVDFESVRLFLERARCHHPAFVLTPRNVGAVADVCRQLEGNPLAIELAAAWVGVLSLGEISRRLKDPLQLLTAGDRTAPSRQRTLRGALDWSYELLSEAEQGLFDRLSVFEGGWTLGAAEAVGTDNCQDDVLDLLSRLVNKSLAVAEANEDGELRYRMPEPARRYGLERLQASGKAGSIRWRHAAQFLELVEKAGLGSRRSRQETWFEPLARERANLRAAHSWMLERGEVGLALSFNRALGEFWRTRLGKGRVWEEVWTVGPMTRPEPAADRPATLLTRREREVAALVGRGLTNRQVSTRLVLSEHTVATHVRTIFKKLGLDSRTQLAAWVARRSPLPPKPV